MNSIIIGGGPAGMMAAFAAAKNGAAVCLFEKNNIFGKKMRITGKGRCNITNAGDDFFDKVTSNPRFLYSAFSNFNNFDAIDFFESLGVKTKTERGMRVFPENDNAHSLVNAFADHLRRIGVKIIKERVIRITVNDGRVSGVLTAKGRYAADNVLIATGGLSYPTTGSTGDGYKMAEELGHKIIAPKPSLVPLVSSEGFCGDLMGLTLKNIGFNILKGGKLIYSDFGELLFTHFGISGPVALSASLFMEDGEYDAVIDLKPALSEEELDKRVIRDLTKYSKRDFINAFDDLLPKSLIETFVNLTGIDQRKKAGEVAKEERKRICRLLKNFTVRITGLGKFEEAIITTGGVCVNEINPSTMESRIVGGLYFAGEVMDVAAYTGGYNLQIAYSTGYTAGISMAKCKGGFPK
jgi:predicted Rossmann fold flavoprotein